jgi:hypothetical protein
MVQRTRYDLACLEPVSQAELSEVQLELEELLECELSRLTELQDDTEALEKELELELEELLELLE